jgi:hypothetical protein
VNERRNEATQRLTAQMFRTRVGRYPQGSSRIRLMYENRAKDARVGFGESEQASCSKTPLPGGGLPLESQGTLGRPQSIAKGRPRRLVLRVHEQPPASGRARALRLGQRRGSDRASGARDGLDLHFTLASADASPSLPCAEALL